MMKRRICFVATLEMSIKAFLVDHMLLLQDIFDLSMVVNTENIRFLGPFGVRARLCR